MAEFIAAAATTAVATTLTGAQTSDPELQSAEVVVEDVKATPAAETDKKTDTTKKEEAKKVDTNKEEVKKVETVKVETTAADNQKVETKTDDKQKVDTAPVTTTVIKTVDTQEPTTTGPIAAEKPPVDVKAKEVPVETSKAAEGDKPTGDKPVDKPVDKPETKVDKPTGDKPETKTTDVTESSSVVPDKVEESKAAVEESSTTTTTTPLKTEETTSKPEETTPPPPPPPPETKDTPTVEVTPAADDKALPETPEVPATSGEGTSAPSGEEKTDKEDAAKVERKSKWKSFVKKVKSLFTEKA